MATIPPEQANAAVPMISIRKNVFISRCTVLLNDVFAARYTKIP
jgi:hypothetical protein